MPECMMATKLHALQTYHICKVKPNMPKTRSHYFGILALLCPFPFCPPPVAWTPGFAPEATSADRIQVNLRLNFTASRFLWFMDLKAEWSDLCDILKRMNGVWMSTGSHHLPSPATQQPLGYLKSLQSAIGVGSQMCKKTRLVIIQNICRSTVLEPLIQYSSDILEPCPCVSWMSSVILAVNVWDEYQP